MVYLIAFLFILYTWILVDLKCYCGLKKFAIFISLLFLILISGLRYRVGGDSLHYMDTYSSMPTMLTLNQVDFEEGYGPLWYLFCALSKSIGTDFVFLQLFHAVIVNLTFVHFFYKKSVSVLACLLIYFLLYYFYYNMEILREALAVCVFCFNYTNLIQKRYVPYYLISLIAVGFHFSALVLLFFPLLYRFVQLKHVYMYMFIGIISISFIFFFIIPQYYNLLMAYAPIIALKLKSYSTLSLNNLLGISFYAIPFLVFSLLYKISGNDVKKFSLSDIYMIRMLLFFLLLGSVNQGIMRISNYLMPLAIPYIINAGYTCFHKKGNAFLKLSFIGCILMLLLQKVYYYYEDTSALSAHTRRYELWYPYESVFNPIRHFNRELIYYNAMYNQSVIRN